MLDVSEFAVGSQELSEETGRKRFRDEYRRIGRFPVAGASGRRTSGIDLRGETGR